MIHAMGVKSTAKKNFLFYGRHGPAPPAAQGRRLSRGTLLRFTRPGAVTCE
jgi:hypothetical protein